MALYVGGAIFYGFTAIFEPIADELGWSYTQISLAASLRGLEMGLLSPLLGILTDRWGPRRLMFGGIIATALGLFLLSHTTSLGMFYGAFVILTLGTSTTTMTVLMTALANWFRNRIGIASGIAISGYGFSGLMIPPIVGLIETYHWRVTVAILALGMLVILLPLSMLFRHKPEQYGYLPDGQPEDTAVFNNNQRKMPDIEVKVSWRQALKSGAFWRIALALGTQGVLLISVVTHVMPYLSSIGIARSTSSLVATGIPLMSIAGRLGFGWLGDKLNRKLVTAAGFGATGLGLLCFAIISNAGIWLLIPFLILFGIGYGGINAMRPALVQEYFGRTSFGTIFGLMMSITMIGGILGLTLAGWVYDNWGSYQGIWLIFVSLPFAALITILTISPVKTPVNPPD